MIGLNELDGHVLSLFVVQSECGISDFIFVASEILFHTFRIGSDFIAVECNQMEMCQYIESDRDLILLETQCDVSMSTVGIELSSTW